MREKKNDVVSTRMTPRMRVAFEKAARMEKRSVSHLIAQILEEWIESRHPELIPPRAEWEAGQTERLRRAEAFAQRVRVPLYDMRAVAGAGQPFSEGTPVRYLELSRRFLGDLDARPEDVVALRVAGDAMAPELVDGDAALVDTGQRAAPPLSNDLWVFRLGNELLIRRLRREGGRLLAICTNPAYASLDLPSERAEGELEILGRVVGRLGKGPSLPGCFSLARRVI